MESSAAITLLIHGISKFDGTGFVESRQGLLCEMISQEGCTGSARSGGEAHSLGRKDRLLKRKVALLWPGHKLETEKRENRSKGKRPSG